MNFPPAPTFVLPIEEDPVTKQATFSPMWLQWFLDVARYFSSIGLGGAAIDHQSLLNLQGGSPAERYHLTLAQLNAALASANAAQQAFAAAGSALAFAGGEESGDGQGPPGAAGPAGSPGAPGAQGPQGASGPPGVAGEDGEDAVPIPGPQGVPGAAGAQGPQGVAGSPGADGDAGEDGLMGPAGPRGFQGPQGFMGPPGEDGEDGWMGPPGPQGIQGVPGGGGGGGATYGSATIDFGASFLTEKAFTVTDAGITTASVIDCFMMGDTTTDNTQNAHIVAGRSFRMTATPGTGNFSLDVGCLIGLAAGTFKIRYRYV